MLRRPLLPTAIAYQSGRRLVSAISRLHRQEDPDIISVSSRTNMSYTEEETGPAAPVGESQRSQRASQRIHDRPQSQAPEARRKGPTPAQPGMGFFPLGYKDAAYQWWTSVTPPVAERNVISCIPYLREAASTLAATSTQQQIPSADHPGAAETTTRIDPFGPRLWRSTMVRLSGKNRGLNEFSIERVDEGVDNTLVMLHGYGAGLGFYYKNFESLSRSEGWKLYALDWLGMGNSTRPAFRICAKDPAGKITEAENWFVDALEEWRKIRKIEKFTILGHSLGGYLAVSYALKYPGHLNKLILASPVGVPEDPYAINADMPEPMDSTFQEEFTVDQHTTTTGNNTLAKRKTGQPATAEPKKRPYPNWLVWLWDANVSPFSIVRLAGPLGPRFVSGWTSRRFNHLPEEEKQTLHDYAYSLFRQKGSGEYVLPYVLAPGAHARRPIINRIQGVGRQTLRPATDSSPAVKETGIPVVFMYGQNDWMDVKGGEAAVEKLKRAKEQALQKATREERENENGMAKVVIVGKAGHHLYLDNPDEFNDCMHRELEETRQWTLEVRGGQRG